MLKEKRRSKKRLTINAIQNGIFYMLFLLLPFAIIPMPWDWLERGTSLLILIVSTVIVALEILKFIWEGKFSIFKNSIDTGIFLVLLAGIISTIFSVDSGLSFWGVDMNLGSGLVSLIAVVLVSISMRSFIDTFEEIVKVLLYFSIGVLVINILSLLSFGGIDFLSFLPAYKEVFSYGLPWTLSANTLLILNGILIITSFGTLVWYKKENTPLFIFNIINLAISLLTFWAFSVNQGLSIAILLFLILIVFVVLTMRYIRFRKSEEKTVKTLILVPLLISIVVFAIFKIPNVKEKILESFNLLTQVSLGGDISWEVISSSISSKFIRAIVGFGENTFVMLYNMFKPVTTEVLAFNKTNFYYGSSEIITQFGEGGIIWIGAWIFLGYLLVKELISQVKELKRSASSEKTLLSLTLGFATLFVYLSSIFVHFGILIKLMFFILISLWIVSNNIKRIKIPDKFVLKMWAIDTKAEKFKKVSKSIENINLVMTVVLGIITLGLIGIWCKILISNIYIASAEAYISTETVKFEEVEPSQEERETFLTEVIDRYAKAEKFEKKNALINRKLALLNLEKVSFYGELYTFSDDQNEKEELLDKIAMHKREVVNQIQKALDRSPQLYSNWETSSSAYMGLLSVGFEDYDRDALNALGKCADLNPGNYEIYYNAAQVYLVQENSEDALAMLIKVLEINPRHVPSLVMSAEINKKLGKDDVYLSYMKAAKAIMEEYGQTETDVYQEVVRDIRQAEGEEE
jgi:tetratricopeptide (TPR) repeat protein